MKQKADEFLDLGKRERQILETVYRLGEGTVSEVRAELPSPPSYSSVRTMLGKLEEKGRLTHRQDGPRYVYRPAVPRKTVQKSTLGRIVRSLFDGSTERAVAALLDIGAAEISPEELDRLEERIRRLKEKSS